MEKGKKLYLNPYCGDPYYNQNNLSKFAINKASEATFNRSISFGAELGKYYLLGKYPGPIIGFHADYSFSQLDASYKGYQNQILLDQEHQQKQNRLLAGVNFITLLRPRTVGYLTLDGGTEWTNISIIGKNTTNTFEYNQDKQQFDFRIGYGLQYYFTPLTALSLNLGYGSGAYAKAGFVFWIF